MSYDLTTPTGWRDYALVDSGGYEKLERFGSYLLIRPEPQAVWDRALPEASWHERADAHFTRDGNQRERGQWEKRPQTRDPWWVTYPLPDGPALRFKLSLSSFKHVGLFPEQADNWDWIAQQTATQPAGASVLNLFAYTGGASLAARARGADVTHVDAVRPVITWARENLEGSGLDGVRWVVEDAARFVAREVRRGRRYRGIILDPPAYGRGPKGEKWLLEAHLNDLLHACARLLDPAGHFFVLNLYSLGFSALIVENLVKGAFGSPPSLTCGELYLPDEAGRKLPLGTYGRFVR
ncbi:MAG: class I SAM-dependent methyltransferase [Catalinimonas sp.]